MIVSVVMSVYNGEKYLKESIESILNQTYKNFEFIIINDGSSDGSERIINEYRKKDSRIKIINNIKNKGLIYSLNKGIEESSGKYIARMDADDIALTNRLEKQVEFMESNPELVMSGTEAYFFIDGLKLIKRKYNAIIDENKIKATLIFSSCFVHPTVIMRRDILIDNNLRYKEEYKHAEDYGLWCEISSKYKVSNLEEPLLKYRVVKNSITRQANKDMEYRRYIFKKIYNSYLCELGFKPTEEELDIHFEIAMTQNLDNYRYSIYDKEKYLSKLEKSINNKFILDEIINQFLKCCIYSKCEDEFFNSKLLINKNFTKKIYLKKRMAEFIKRGVKYSLKV
ncbi:glycosyltransferase family 2 protein [Clostridium perfringens]